MTSVMTSRMLKPQQVAQQLSISVSAVYQLMASGQLAFVRVRPDEKKRGTRRIEVADVDRYVAKLKELRRSERVGWLAKVG